MTEDSRNAMLPIGFLLSASTASLLVLGVMACAAVPERVASRTVGEPSDGHPADGYVVSDADVDDLHSRRREGDDRPIRAYGHATSQSVREAIATVVGRYYSAAASGNGTRACALINPRLAERTNFSNAVPSAYASVAGSSLFRGRTCVEVESTLFGFERARLARAARAVLVTSVRLRGRHALAILRFRALSERYLVMERVRGGWSVDALLDEEMP